VAVRHENVLGLEVPVHHTVFVSIAERIRGIAKEADRVGHGQRAIA
jgi:hypothetical protein